MAINKIDNHIPSHNVSQDKVKEATSVKKEKLQNLTSEVRKTSLTDTTIFSDDAKRLQETEVILQNAIQRLKEMDEINLQNIIGIEEKIENNFYDNDKITQKIVEDIMPEAQLRETIEMRIKAEKYVSELQKIDADTTIDDTKLDKIRERIDSGFYNEQKVIDSITDNILEMMEVLV